MKTYIKEPGQPWVEKEIGNSLKSWQDLVGGLIECVNLGENVILICNEEGKLISTCEQNIVLSNNDIVYGTVFILKDGENGEFGSVDEYDLQYVEEVTETIEQIKTKFKSLDEDLELLDNARSWLLSFHNLDEKERAARDTALSSVDIIKGILSMSEGDNLRFKF